MDQAMRDRIEKVLEEFDYETVKDIMELKSWTWTCRHPTKVWENRLPTFAELRNRAKELLVCVTEESATVAEQGRLRAEIDDGTLSLMFVACETIADREERECDGSQD